LRDREDKIQRALISPDNSILRNAIGWPLVILIIPIAMLAAVIAIPFRRPIKLSAEEVSAYIRDLMQDTGSAWDWDDFISLEISDPTLENIRLRASKVALPVDEDGMDTLRQLLSEVEGITSDDGRPILE